MNSEELPKRWNFKNLTGHRFGKLVVASYAGRDSFQRAMWNCQCDCGQSCVVASPVLRKSPLANCGCIRTWAVKTHGKSKTATYRSWCSMKARCDNPKHKYFENYGARGISICPRWVDSYENFLSDLGERPSLKFTLERINNEKGYSPDNCRWSIRKEQNRNRRSNKIVRFKGESHCISEWAEITGLDQEVIGSRLRMGWPAHLALTVKPSVGNRLKHHR